MNSFGVPGTTTQLYFAGCYIYSITKHINTLLLSHIGIICRTKLKQSPTIIPSYQKNTPGRISIKKRPWANKVSGENKTQITGGDTDHITHKYHTWTPEHVQKQQLTHYIVRKVSWRSQRMSNLRRYWWGICDLDPHELASASVSHFMPPPERTEPISSPARSASPSDREEKGEV